MPKIKFEPSDFYQHEVLKFSVKHSSLRDKVQSYNENNEFWEADKFLTACHGKLVPDSKSREGRKLKISEYYTRMKYKPV